MKKLLFLFVALVSCSKVNDSADSLVPSVEEQLVKNQVLLKSIFNSQDFNLFTQKSNLYFEIIRLYEQSNPDLFNGKKFPETLENLLINEGYVDNFLQMAETLKEKFYISKEMATELLNTVPILKLNMRLNTKSLIWDCSGGCTYNHGTGIQACADSRLEKLALLAIGLISSGGAAAAALLVGGFYIAVDYNICTYNAGQDLERCKILCSQTSVIGNAQ